LKNGLDPDVPPPNSEIQMSKSQPMYGNVPPPPLQALSLQIQQQLQQKSEPSHMQHSLPPQPPISSGFSQPSAPISTVIEPPLSQDDANEFNQILDNLSGTKESIKNGNAWILAHGANARAISSILKKKNRRS